MSNSFENNSNPYAPTTSLEHSSEIVDQADAKLIKDYRSQILALGVLWLVFAVLCLGVVIALLTGAITNLRNLEDANHTTMALILGAIGIGWAVSGVMALMKIQTGVIIGLVLSYLSLLGNVLNVNVCGIVVLIAVVIQAHRVISFAKRIRARGYQLTQRV